ncbi:Asparagine synthetase domain-containing protein 1 [Linum perenne]
MCGIALIVAGVRIGFSSLFPDVPPSPPLAELKLASIFSVDDLKSALRRRGPDSLGSKKVKLVRGVRVPEDSGEDELVVSVGELEQINCSTKCVREEEDGELYFIGATLQLRGRRRVMQPFVDSSRNVLVFNGEIFGGVRVGKDDNDSEVLMQTLEKCCSCGSNGHSNDCTSSGEGKSSVLEVLSLIKGPWAIIYWQESSRTLWFGRDAFGRRSLLVHWPDEMDSRLLLSSVSPMSSADQSYDVEVKDGTLPNFWEELSCGLYSVSLNYSKQDGYIAGVVQRHEWANNELQELIRWERASVIPQADDLCHGSKMEQRKPFSHPGETDMLKPGTILPLSVPVQTSVSRQAQNVLDALRKSVMLRTSENVIFQAITDDSSQEECSPIAILFSGGLDSMILAALLDQSLDPSYGIDLLTVSFDGQSAPDRITAKAGADELRKISPSRRWKLVEIDAELSKLTKEMKHVKELIHPANTYMDLNIGTALWLAANGDGWTYHCDVEDRQHRVQYKSRARIVLVGSGADEQCAGYGRHRTKYRCGSWVGLHEEMKLDMQRIWKRNMGRDDRCIADTGKEARFPFLDEDVIKTLLNIPLWEVANLDEPSGVGDKKILREVARLLGLQEASVLPKRAIQFGSRIARESNRKNFGSNRAANQASAGSVVINHED